MSTIAYAARQPLALIVLACAIVAGLSVTLWLLPLGLLAYGAMVLLGARDPALAAASQRAPRPRLSSPALRSRIETIERTQRAIQRSVDEAGGPLERLLATINAQTSDLVDQAYALGDKGQIIEGYMAQINIKDLQARIGRVDQQLAATSDSYTLQQLQETRAALAEKQRHAADLNTYIGRVYAQLENIAANLDNVLAETVRLRTADAVSADSLTNQVAQQLNDLKTDMNTFQQVLDTALATNTP